MKRVFLILAIAFASHNVRAAGLPPESFGGAAWGALIGGLSGADCHNNWSNDGAWIGAGVGFLTGTLIGESRRQQYKNAPYAYPPPAYGYGYAPAPIYSAPRPSRPSYVPSRSPASAARHSVWQSAPEPRYQIPDAPRVPDAPTF
jgi:hypothetical protein